MRSALVALIVVVATGCATRQQPPTANRLLPTAAVPARAEQAIDTLLEGFDRGAAMGHVEFMSRFWRLAGNDGFDRSIDRIQQRLVTSGFADDRRGTPRAQFGEPTARVHAYRNSGHGWDYAEGTLAIVNADGTETPILTKAQHRLALCINSFSTPPGGRVLDVVDVGTGDKAEDFAGKDLENAIVLGDASPSSLWRHAMPLGAAGVVSTALPDYIVPVPPGAPVPPRDEWDILQWSSVPYDAGTRGFGFKASPRAAATLRRALADGRTRVRVTIDSSFTERDARMLIAEIPGTVEPDERIVIAAHVQEPGANDNASGSATLAELAVAMRTAIRDGSMPAPGRTITFLWIDEISGSRQWLKDFPEQAKQVRWMFSLDMTGEDVSKTGGSFLVERWPDPGAVYDREWDPHSEWGRGDVDPKTLKGDLINDLHLAVARRVGDRTGWVVRSNPYEGGSDHTVFGSQGTPSLLDWHFTDRYYHTNFDTPDKVSADEMRNVATAIGATAWLMASATPEEAVDVARLVEAAGRERLARERTETAPDRDTAVAAWEKWYAEAVASASRLAVRPAPRAQTPAARVTREAVILAEDRRARSAGDYELLLAAAAHRDPLMRARGVRALGRLEQTHRRVDDSAGVLLDALADRDPRVRRAAAYALAQLTSSREDGARSTARAALLKALDVEKDDVVAAALMESAARLADAASVEAAEAAILAGASREPGADGVASALEVLTRRAGEQAGLGPRALAWLRDAAVEENASPESRRLAAGALLASSAIDATLASELFASDDWQIRRLALLAQPEPLVRRALEDVDAHVRHEAARIFARRLMETKDCAPILAAVRDPDAHVALEAIDALAECREPVAADVLTPLAAVPGGIAWHRASHAIVSLAQADPARARDLLPRHLADAAWPVRMYAARAAAVLQDDETLEMLARDAHPNVREAAILGLRDSAARAVAVGFPPSRQAERRERLQRAIAAALTDLRDPQLIRTAARAAAEAADPAALAPAMLDAIAAIDGEGADTTIDARVALVDALKAAVPGMKIPDPPPARAPETPSVEELRSLPVRARIEMARGGAFEIEFLPEEAPAAVARFARLARAGYYDGLTFHRVVPNFVVQGGSPWANEYAGAPRFQRDELGFARHERGAVGISTRGRDTGDAQIFIDLVDLPRLNHEYTVFARVVSVGTSGMDVVDGILEADVIRRITLR